MAASALRLCGFLALAALATLAPVAAVRAPEEDMASERSALLQPSTGLSVTVESECADAWEEFVRRLGHFNGQMQKHSRDEAVQAWSNMVANLGKEAAEESYPHGIPPKPFGVATVDAEFEGVMGKLLAEGNFKQVAIEWRAFERTYDIAESVAVFLVELIATEWGRRETWESAATFWDMYNDFSPGVAPYVVEVLKDLPSPHEHTDWFVFKAENKKVLTQAVSNMFQDLRNYCLVAEEPRQEEPEPVVIKTKPPAKPDWTVEGPDGSICPTGCDSCSEAKEKAKRGKVWCYTKKMPKSKPNSRCNALLYSGSFEVGGNDYGYRYLCKP